MRCDCGEGMHLYLLLCSFVLMFLINAANVNLAIGIQKHSVFSISEAHCILSNGFRSAVVNKYLLLSV